jgi:hypothetical protein
MPELKEGQIAYSIEFHAERLPVGEFLFWGLLPGLFNPSFELFWHDFTSGKCWQGRQIHYPV